MSIPNIDATYYDDDHDRIIFEDAQSDGYALMVSVSGAGVMYLNREQVRDLANQLDQFLHATEPVEERVEANVRVVRHPDGTITYHVDEDQARSLAGL